MLSCAVPRNWRSVAEHVWTTAARLFPPTRRTSDPMAKIATASPAAAVMRGFTPLLSALARGMLHHPFGWGRSSGAHKPRAPVPPSGRARGRERRRGGASKDQAAVGAVPLHPDCLVDPDRGGVLRADEETHSRHLLEEKPAEVAHPALCVALVAHGRIDPHLLDLHGRRRPRRRLGLEEDPAALDPDPGATLLDLRARPPAEPVRVARHRVDADLLLVRGRAGRQQQLEVLLGRRAEPGFAGRWRLGERVHRLAGAVVAWRRHPFREIAPELVHRAL